MRFGFVAAVCTVVLYSSTVFAQTSLDPAAPGAIIPFHPPNTVSVDLSDRQCAPVVGGRFIDPSHALRPVEGLATPPCNVRDEYQRKSGDDLPQAGSSGSPHSVRQIEELLESGEPPQLGLANAPVTIVVFGDFECSFCKRMNELLESQLVPRHKTDVSIVYRYFPLPQHPWARSAAQMAECVKSQDQAVFWKLGDYLYTNQDSFSMTSLRGQVVAFLAKEGHTDPEAFATCVDRGTTANLVDKDIQMGAGLGVHSTPTLFVNGEQLHGVHELQQLELAVKSALDATKSTEYSTEKEKL